MCRRFGNSVDIGSIRTQPDALHTPVASGVRNAVDIELAGRLRVRTAPECACYFRDSASIAAAST